MKNYFSGMRLINILKDEFRDYNASKLQRDMLSGITVAAVALPLALAYGVAYGATAAAGLITAILAGFIMSSLGGMPYQVSGPTGALSAVIIVLAGRFGLEDIWIASIMAGFMIVLMGIFKWGQIINFIPSAVVTGFMSGIAAIVFIGQIDNLLGVNTASTPNAFLSLTQYFALDQPVNVMSIGIGVLVMAIMILWPRKLDMIIPGSLLSLIAATVITSLFAMDVPVIGHIPQTLVLEHRLLPSHITWERITNLIGPAMSIAVLAAIKSLLCGAVASRQKGIKMDSIQELFGLGVGNIVIPFFGGIPASGALARSSLAIKSGAATRLTSVFQAITLLVAALLLGPVISNVPLASLGGVLAVTAWRMNDWGAIRDIFKQRFTGDIVIFIVTLIGTVWLDLTQAIILGLAFSALIFVFQSSKTEVIYKPILVSRMREMGYEMYCDADRILVVYVVGPLFFGTVHTFNTVIDEINSNEDIILSLRTVPLLDTTGISALEEVIQRLESEGRRVYLSGLTRPVEKKLEQAGITELLGEDRIFWSADQAIMAADRYRAQLAEQTIG